jgi:hypothetical protein
MYTLSIVMVLTRSPSFTFGLSSGTVTKLLRRRSFVNLI